MWEELYKIHYSELVLFGTSMCGSREAAEDLAQETFVRAMCHCDQIEDLSPNKRRAWLYRTMKNLFYDRCRKAAVESRYLQGLQEEAAADRRMQEVENDALMQTISPEDRVLFQLRYFDGYTAAEIAQMMDLPPGTVRSRLSRCRSYLKDCL